MDTYFLASNDLSHLLSACRQWGEVHAPQTDDSGRAVFAPVTADSRLLLDYQRTRLPPKKYLLPFRETTLSYRCGSGYRLARPAPGTLVLFGVHPCDLAAITYLDRVFLDSHPDPHYALRRSRLTLVGLSCRPDALCGCDPATVAGWPRGDLFLESVPGGFLLTASSRTGLRLLMTITPHTTRRRPVETDNQTIPPCRPHVPETDTIPPSPLWEEFAARCLGCGACSVCCPTCYCYAVHEQGDLGGSRAERYRTWDNCLFATHGLVAGGHDFRPTRLERLHYRFRHKYFGFGPQAGEAGCVGCGRCATFCPVDIDLQRIRKEAPDAGPVG